jgi:hypothetical protein
MSYFGKIAIGSVLALSIPVGLIAAGSAPAGAAGLLTTTTTLSASVGCNAYSSGVCDINLKAGDSITLIANISDEVSSILEADILPTATVDFALTQGGLSRSVSVNLALDTTSNTTSSCALLPLSGTLSGLLEDSCTVTLTLTDVNTCGIVSITPLATYSGDLLTAASNSSAEPMRITAC